MQGCRGCDAPVVGSEATGQLILLNVEGLLEPLAEASAGHQYFDLYPRHVLVVSVGEYDSFWWDRVETL
jgi:hypothetical protein